MATSKPVTRRRRTPEVARAEIVDAAMRCLAAHPREPLSVSAVMERTTLSRKSFYVYFDDVPALIVALAQPLRARADATILAWETASDQREAGRAALRAAAETYREHGPLLASVMRPASDDPGLLAARDALMAPLVAAAERLLRADPATPPGDVGAMARALATMNVHTLLDRAPGASDAELDQLVRALAVIWERAVGDGAR